MAGTLGIVQQPDGAEIKVKPSDTLDGGRSVVANGIATKLVMQIANSRNFTFAAGKKYRLTIINPDGEKAIAEFTAT